MIYITSDSHFQHNKDFIYEPRGFFSIEEHDEEIIKRWNKIIKPNDIVYHLGDIAMGKDIDYSIDCVRRLNGEIHWIRGNHDTEKRWEEIGKLPHIIKEGYAAILKYNKFKFYLSHYPTMTASIGEKSYHRSLISLCGHCHTDNCFKDWKDYMIYHVEVDAHDCYPVSIEQIINDIRNFCEPL